MSRNAALSVLILMALAACSSATDRASKMETIDLVIGGENFRVEVARTDAQRQQGLMNRPRLGPREGMIFVFPADQRLSFWMKNTLVPLSIAFLNSRGEILQIEDMEPLSERTVQSRRMARLALEVPRGTFRELGVREGDRLVLPESFP